VEAFNSLEVNVRICNVAGSKKDQTIASKLIVLRSVPVADFKCTLGNQLSKCGPLEALTRQTQAPLG
jgi:hypothetical protein